MQLIHSFPGLDVDAPAAQLRATFKAASTCGSVAGLEGCVACRIADEAHECEGLGPAVPRSMAVGTVLFREGEPLGCLYAIRSGMVKLSASLKGGREQVTAFRTAGDLIGLSALVDQVHIDTAVVLDAAEVVPIRAVSLQQVNAANPTVGFHLWALLSREMVRDKKRMLLLGTLSAEEKVAAFLLNLSTRGRVPGRDDKAIHLPMTRAEIGSYLGLTLETVSRVLHRLERRGVISLDRRHVQITQPDVLRKYFSPRLPEEHSVHAC